MGGGVRQIERQRRREDWADLAGENAIVRATELTVCQPRPGLSMRRFVPCWPDVSATGKEHLIGHSDVLCCHTEI